MNYDFFTHKLSEALQDAHTLVRNKKHSKLDELHLLYAMIEQKDGYLPSILKQLKLSLEEIKTKIINKLVTYPSLEGSYQITIAPSLEKLLLEAEQVMKSLGDSYLSTQHLFLAGIQNNSSYQEVFSGIDL